MHLSLSDLCKLTITLLTFLGSVNGEEGGMKMKRKTTVEDGDEPSGK